MKQNVNKVTSAQHQFVDHMGQQMVSWGLPRTTGRVWAYLLMHGDAVTLDDIVRDLHVAKSGASVGARQLVAFGLAQAVGERGSRRVLFRALDSIDAVFSARNESARAVMRLFKEGSRVASTPAKRATLRDFATVLDEILVRESAALTARARKGRRA